MNKKENAYPITTNFYSVGLTKFELACLQLMSASVTANTFNVYAEGVAKLHAQNAVRLAQALFEELESEEGR